MLAIVCGTLFRLFMKLITVQAEKERSTSAGGTDSRSSSNQNLGKTLFQLKQVTRKMTEQESKEYFNHKPNFANSFALLWSLVIVYELT